jgi:hypothetical protein
MPIGEAAWRPYSDDMTKTWIWVWATLLFLGASIVRADDSLIVRCAKYLMAK